MFVVQLVDDKLNSGELNKKQQRVPHFIFRDDPGATCVFSKTGPASNDTQWYKVDQLGTSDEQPNSNKKEEKESIQRRQ